MGGSYDAFIIQYSSARSDQRSQSVTQTSVRHSVEGLPLRVAGPLAIGIAVVVNSLLFVVADVLGVFPATVMDPGSGQPFALMTVAVASGAGAFGATVVYALLSRFVADADRWFRILAVVVLLVSFVTPFTIPGAPATMIATLLVMHMVVAAVSVWVFTADSRN